MKVSNNLILALLSFMLMVPALAAADTKSELGDPPCQIWQNKEEETEAILLCLPEMGLHSGAYEDFGRDMANRGIVSYAMDLRGFGKCAQEQARSRVDIAGSIDDTLQMLRVIHAKFPGKPVYLVGEGLGAAIALSIAVHNPELISGEILSNPGNKWLSPGWHTRLAEGATNDRATYERWRGDTLSRQKLTAQEKNKIQAFMSKTDKLAGELHRLPIMVVLGKGDRFLDEQSSENVYEAMTSTDKEVNRLSRVGHIIFEYGQTPAVFNDLIETWLSLPAPKQEAKRLL